MPVHNWWTYQTLKYLVVFLSIVRKMVKRRSGCLLGNEGKRQEGLLVERETTSEGVFISTDFNLSFSLLFGAFFKKNKKNFPVHTTSLLPRLVSSGWVFNSFSLMSPSFDVTHRMHRGTWEVLTSAHNSNNICRQDKQQNQRRNSPSTTSTIPPPPPPSFFFLPFYIICILSRSHLFGAVSYRVLHDQQRQDGSWQSMILVI